MKGLVFALIGFVCLATAFPGGPDDLPQLVIISENVPVDLTTEESFTTTFDWDQLTGDLWQSEKEGAACSPPTMGLTRSFVVTLPSNFVGVLTATVTKEDGESDSDFITTVSTLIASRQSGPSISIPIDENSPQVQIVTFTLNNFANLAPSEIEDILKRAGSRQATFSRMTPCDTGSGDPVFHGLNGQSFVFGGEAGKVFHIFSDPHISFNSLFSFAQKDKKGTVLSAVGLRLGHTTVTFDTHSFLGKKTFNATINGVSTILVGKEGSTCINVVVGNDRINIETPTHSFFFKRVLGKIGTHIEEDHIDFKLSHPAENVSELGGIIGQTSSRSAKLNKDNLNFITHDLLSTDAKTNVFQSIPLECNKASQNRRSAKSSRAC